MSPQSKATIYEAAKPLYWCGDRVNAAEVDGALF
jgi:hypothetical protein